MTGRPDAGRAGDAIALVPTVTPNHQIYLAVAVLTHGLVGYAVVRGLTGYPAVAGALGAVLPDVDLFVGAVLAVPLVHRGAVHTPAALAVVGGGALLLGVSRRRLAAFAVGFLTHLVLDSGTGAGVMWLFPASTARVGLDLPVHGLLGTAVLWLASLAIVRFGPRSSRSAVGG